MSETVSDFADIPEAKWYNFDEADETVRWYVPSI